MCENLAAGSLVGYANDLTRVAMSLSGMRVVEADLQLEKNVVPLDEHDCLPRIYLIIIGHGSCSFPSDLESCSTCLWINSMSTNK